jgi:TolA-binding protein
MSLGERIQEALELETQPAQQLRVARIRLLEHVTDARRGARRSTAWQLRYAGLAAIALLAMAALVMQTWPRPISFVTDAGESDPGDVLLAGEHEPLRVEFSEGSRMLLHEGASARVLETRAAGARVLLESGVADVSVVHRQGRATGWRFEAGPYRVLVKGTQFELSWQPAAQALSLTMKAGSVELSGPCLPAPRIVERGASLRLSCPKTPAKAELAGTTPPMPEAPAARAPTPDAMPSPKGTPNTPGLERKAPASSFEASCETAGRAELVAWANRERLAGSVARAHTALLALRRRFPGSSEAGTAAFTLGRMAFDQRADYAEAARWFAAYLKEQPNGPLMGDAAGRLLEAHQLQGKRAAARRDAKAYLRRFPDGPYASRAKRILAE